MPEKIQHLDWSSITPNQYNRGGGKHRSGFSKASLAELAASIAEHATLEGVHGIVQPIIVRPIAQIVKNGPTYELVAGERRWTAAGMLDKKLKVPAIVRDYDEGTAREVNIIENFQREGLHFLEEAQGFQDLLDLKLAEPYTVEKIAQRISKDGKDGKAAYVYARLKLLRIPELARKACFAGKMNHSLALLVARIPDPKLAIKATIELLAPIHRTEEAALDPEIEPLSFRAAKEHVRNHYMVRLKDAPFDRENADLVPLQWTVTAGKESVTIEALWDVIDGTHSMTTPLPVTEPKLPDGEGKLELYDSSIDDGLGHQRTVYWVTQDKQDLFGPTTKGDAEAFLDALRCVPVGGQAVITRSFGGPCDSCPFRSGNLKELFPDVESEDVCTNPGCFKKKKDADLKRAQALAREEGVTLLKPSESNRLFQDGRLLETGTGYVDLADPVPGKTRKTWKDFLDAELPNGVWQAAVIQARDDLMPPVTHLLLPVAVATEAAQTAGMKSAQLSRITHHASLETPVDREAEEAARQQRIATAKVAEAEALVLVRAKVTKLKPDKKFWLFLAQQIADGNFYARHQLDSDKKITQFWKKRSEAELRALLVEALCFGDNVTWQGELRDTFKAHCQHFKVDWKKCLKRAGQNDAALRQLDNPAQ